jgi:Carboxypeptidase regulatory-like domain
MGKFPTLLLLGLVTLVSAHAQAPTGIIAGVVTDPSGAAVSGVRISITNQATGLSRKLVTSEDGAYSAPSLPPGNYQIAAEAPGFSPLERTATIEAGTTTTLNLQLQVGVSESVSINTSAPLIRYEHPQVSGLISRSQIESLPLNGRNVLELAKLEPGVQPPARASSNRTFVPALGQPQGNNGRGTRITVDGGSVMAVGNGGSAMGFSQEVVQEFQVATVNFDLTTGLTNGAAINVVTRSGGNKLHGTGFYFFRDHNLAAYPALKRDQVDPDPFFQRRQFGVALGGPVRRDQLFFFGTYERNEQRSVVETKLSGEFAHLSGINPSPYFGNQFSLRLDGRVSSEHTAFLRYSHDGVSAFGPPTTQPNAHPSFWVRQQPGPIRASWGSRAF